MTPLKALLWDVDGTIAETERDGHRVAFNRAFEACGLDWRWDEARYGELLRIAGGRERLLYDMASRREAPPLAFQRESLARNLHEMKNLYYARLVEEGRIPLREGVAALMDQCLERGVRMALVTTTSRANAEALMRLHFGAGWAGRFAAVISGEQVHRKKPDPHCYRLALEALRIEPLEAVAIEDSPGGVAAARGADVPVIVTRSAYFGSATIEGAIAIGPGLHRRPGWRPALDAGRGADGPVGLDDIEAWRAEMDIVSQYA